MPSCLMTAMALVLPVGEIAHRYRQGESTTDLGRAFSVSDEVIRKRLVESGVTLRDKREAARLRWQREREAKANAKVIAPVTFRDDWRQHAACVDHPELEFFPKRGEPAVEAR